jgi:hypothetical protein
MYCLVGGVFLESAQVCGITTELLLLLRWGETVSLWKWASNRLFVHPPNDVRVNMEQHWNDTDRGKLKHSERNLSQHHFVHHKSHMDLGVNLGPHSDKLATNCLSYGTPGITTQ